MSRDFTPEEAYLFEQANRKWGYTSILDSMERMTFTYNGITRPLYSKESMENRRKYPLLGSLYHPFDKLYSFLSQVSGGTELLQQHENALKEYIETGRGDKDSFLIKWYEGKLDTNFHYSNRNDAMFFACVQDEVGKLYRFDPAQGRCFWFPISQDKCFSAWYAPDAHDGDQLQMKLEKRAEDGSMGSHCELIYDESYATANLSQKAVYETVLEICEDAGLDVAAETVARDITEKVMSVFGLKKQDLEAQILAAKNRADATDSVKKEQAPER